MVGPSLSESAARKGRFVHTGLRTYRVGAPLKAASESHMLLTARDAGDLSDFDPSCSIRLHTVEAYHATSEHHESPELIGHEPVSYAAALKARNGNIPTLLRRASSACDRGKKANETNGSKTQPEVFRNPQDARKAPL